MGKRPGPNRYARPIDPFAYDKGFSEKLAMADVEGRRKPGHEHDHLPETYDREPWTDDLRQVRSYTLWKPRSHR